MIIEDIKKRGKTSITRLGDMKNFFKNAGGCNLKQEIYRVLSVNRRHLSYAITSIKAGRINGEFFMTKGHYHKIPSTEIYFVIKGRGKAIMQKGSDFRKIELKEGNFYEIPEGYAHRSINTGKNNLEFLSIYFANAGHDYESIEKRGFKKRFY